MDFEFYVFASIDRPGHYYGSGYNEKGLTVGTRLYKNLGSVRKAQANNYTLNPGRGWYVPMKVTVKVLNTESIEL